MLEILEGDLQRLTSDAIDHALNDFADRSPFDPMKPDHEHAMDLAYLVVGILEKVRAMLANDVRPPLAALVSQGREAGARLN